jgi:hypothetical protein
MGFFPSHAGPHAVEAATDPAGSRAPCPLVALSAWAPARSRAAADPLGSGVPRRVTRRANCSWLNAAALAATSAPTAGLLPPNI